MILNLQIAQHSIITTWHSDFEEGIWFSIFGADHTEIPIDKVVFLDMTRGMRQADLQTALNKIEQSAR